MSKFIAQDANSSVPLMSQFFCKDHMFLPVLLPKANHSSTKIVHSRSPIGSKHHDVLHTSDKCWGERKGTPRLTQWRPKHVKNSCGACASDASWVSNSTFGLTGFWCPHSRRASRAGRRRLALAPGHAPHVLPDVLSEVGIPEQGHY